MQTYIFCIYGNLLEMKTLVCGARAAKLGDLLELNSYIDVLYSVPAQQKCARFQKSQKGLYHSILIFEKCFRYKVSCSSGNYRPHTHTGTYHAKREEMGAVHL